MTPLAQAFEQLDRAHRAERIGQHHLDEILLGDRRGGFLIGLADAGIDEKQVDLPVAETLAQSADRSGIGYIDGFDREARWRAALESGKIAGRAALRGDHSRVALQPFLGQREAQPARCADDENSRFRSHLLRPLRPSATDARCPPSLPNLVPGSRAVGSQRKDGISACLNTAPKCPKTSDQES